MAQTMSMPPKGFSKKPDRPGRYPRPLSLQTLAAKLGPQRLYTRSRGDAAATTVLIVPAGAGQGHTMAGFARLWTAFTGRRVIGLTTSTDAAPGPCARGPGRELRHRSVPRQRPKAPASVPLHRDDVLVLDEASQLSTSDLVMLSEAARQAGARVIATGGTAQLGGRRSRWHVPAAGPGSPRRPAA